MFVEGREAELLHFFDETIQPKLGREPMRLRTVQQYRQLEHLVPTTLQPNWLTLECKARGLQADKASRCRLTIRFFKNKYYNALDDTCYLAAFRHRVDIQVDIRLTPC